MRWQSIAIAVVLVFACNVGPTEQTGLTEEPNVTVHTGVELVTTDTAVLVNDEELIDFGRGPFGFGVYGFTEFTYGGLYEAINDHLVDESWFLDVARRVITDVRGDTVFSRSLDFGDVALEETPAHRIEMDTVIVFDAGDHVRVYENILLNRIIVHSRVLRQDGSEVVFHHESCYDRILAGQAVELTASGSDEIAPTSAAFTPQPGIRITALWNGEYLRFDRRLPLFHTDYPLVVELSRSIDPDMSVLHLHYVPPPRHDVDPDLLRRASAVFQLQERTDRLVIPASALAEVASHVTDAEGWYVFRIYEYHVMEDVLEIERLKAGITEMLTGLQSNGFGLYVRIRR
ncbi:MAG: hypothetical protein JSW51_06455 [Gemmatimonadota bacterium]|nr:MAG: hypothetical protein JSW51_06455 [Gemmatimonadota bacterium]